MSFMPSTIQQQFPNGIPQLTAPQVTGQQIQGTQMDPQQAISAFNSYLLPLFQQQNRGLTEDLTAAGIIGGTSGQAQQELGSGQQSQLMSDIQPYILANQQLGQDTQKFNAQQRTGANQFNANALLGTGQFNIGNLFNSAQMDSNFYNNMLQYFAGLQNQDWLGQLSAASNFAGGTMGTAASGFQPMFQQPSPFNLGGIASAFTPAPQPTTQVQQPPQTQPPSSDSGPYSGPFGYGA